VQKNLKGSKNTFNWVQQGTYAACCVHRAFFH